MQINTTTDTLELTKRERESLGKAADLAAAINKHAGGPLQELAGKARAAIKLLTDCLDGTPPVLEKPEHYGLAEVPKQDRKAG